MAQAGMVLGGRYELAEQVGNGGYCEVWRATDTVLSRPVAVKLLHPGYARKAEALARFRAEARHAGALPRFGRRRPAPALAVTVLAGLTCLVLASLIGFGPSWHGIRAPSSRSSSPAPGTVAPVRTAGTPATSPAAQPSATASNANPSANASTSASATTALAATAKPAHGHGRENGNGNGKSNGKGNGNAAALSAATPSP